MVERKKQSKRKRRRRIKKGKKQKKIKKMSSLSLVLSASVERGMRESGVSFARAVLSELDSAGVLNCSLESALKLFDFDRVKVSTKRSVAAKAKRAKELMSKPKKAKLSRTAKP